MEADVSVVLELLNVVQMIKGIIDNDNDGNLDKELLPQEVTDLLVTMGDGEQGNNDIEATLVEIKESLMYNENYTALSEISSRLEVIDTRLDKGFEMISGGFSLVIVSFVTLLSWKFFGWIMRLTSV